MAIYVAQTEDYAGLHPNGTAICEDGYWFLTPSCRTNTANCVPMLAGLTPNGQDLAQFMQKSVAFELPLALGTPLTDGESAIHFHFNVTFFWFRPGSRFLPLRPLPVQFPTYDPEAFAVSDFRTMFKGAMSEKWVSRDLHVLSPQVPGLWLRTLDAVRSS